MDLWAEVARVFHSEIGFGTMVVRLCVAALLGLVIGLDREYRQHPAGMRTHMLVSLASATFAVLTFELIALTENEGSVVGADPVRAIGAVTAGVSFLAAGTIIQARGRVQGLTTGAGMWLAGAIGLACGIGAFGVATAATLLGVLILALLGLVSPMLPRKESSNGHSAND
jgi:putative Mg2+ transporter-C (MgtC) family protein